jgi:hypothetical protein
MNSEQQLHMVMTVDRHPKASGSSHLLEAVFLGVSEIC